MKTTLTILACLALMGCKTPPEPLTVQWTPYNPVITHEGIAPNTAHLPGYEVGFRDDGVVMWRYVGDE